MDALGKAPGTPPATTERKSPLALLPPGWREPVGFFYAAYSDILKGSTGIVTRLRFWIQEDGLTLDEAKKILRRLLAPEEAARIQFPGQLIARLAELVIDALTDRRKVVEQAAARERAAAEKAGAAPPEEWRRLAAGIGLGG